MGPGTTAAKFRRDTQILGQHRCSSDLPEKECAGRSMEFRRCVEMVTVGVIDVVWYCAGARKPGCEGWRRTSGRWWMRLRRGWWRDATGDTLSPHGQGKEYSVHMQYGAGGIRALFRCEVASVTQQTRSALISRNDQDKNPRKKDATASPSPSARRLMSNLFDLEDPRRSLHSHSLGLAAVSLTPYRHPH